MHELMRDKIPRDIQTIILWILIPGLIGIVVAGTALATTPICESLVSVIEGY